MIREIEAQRVVRRRLRHPPPSPPVCGFSAGISEIARASGFIRMLRGTGESHLWAARAHYAAKVSVGQ